MLGGSFIAGFFKLLPTQTKKKERNKQRRKHFVISSCHQLPPALPICEAPCLRSEGHVVLSWLKACHQCLPPQTLIFSAATISPKNPIYDLAPNVGTKYTVTALLSHSGRFPLLYSLWTQPVLHLRHEIKTVVSDLRTSKFRSQHVD